MMVNELLSKINSVKVDRGLTTRLESLTDSHSAALIGGKGAKSNANASSRMYSLTSLMTLPDEEFDVLGEDELVKDRLGDQRGGSEWEPIKILLRRENSGYARNSQPRIPTRVCQGRVVTSDLPTLEANPKRS
jgi:hypothetical protein